MRPLHLRATDFASYSEIDLDLRRVTLTAVVGDNGSGKSSLLAAMRVALFGSAVASLDGFVRQGAPGLIVDLEFLAGEARYRVVREHGRRGQKASLSRLSGEAWTPVCEAKVRDVDAAIVKIIGADHDTFILAHHLPQGGLTRFATLDAAERKSWLASKLPLEEYARLEQVVKGNAKAKAEQVARLLAEAEILHEQSQVTPSLATDVHAWTRELDSARGDLEAHEKHADALKREEETAGAFVAARDDARIEYARAQDSVSATGARLRTARESMERLREQSDTPVDDPVSDPEAARVEIERLEQAVSARGQLDGLRVREREITAEIDALESERAHTSECPFCGAEPQHQKAGLAEATYRDKIARLQSERAGITDEISAIASTTSESAPCELAALRADYERHLAAREVRAKLEATCEFLREAVAEHEKAKEAHDSALAGEHASKTALHEAEEALAPYADIHARMEEAREQASLARTRAIKAEASLERALTEAKRVEELAAKAQRARDEAALHTRAQADLELLAKAYGRSGIQARLIEEAVGAIEESANTFLARFTDGLTVTLETQRENKSGGVRETLDILVSDASGTRPIERFSGGETTRVCFALAAGLSAFIQGQSDVAAGSFAVDEPEYLDPVGIGELLSCLHLMAADVPLVMLISHIEGVADTMPHTIAVRKGPNGSTVEVVEA